MAPDQVKCICVLDLRYEHGELIGDLEYYIRPVNMGFSRVRWVARRQPEGFFPIGNGIAYIYDDGQVDPVPGSTNAEISALGDSLFCWHEGGWQPGQPWLMLIMILPEGYTIDAPNHTPINVKAADNRLALYWILSGDKEWNIDLVWTLTRFMGDLRAEVQRLNRSIVGRTLIVSRRSSNAPIDEGVAIIKPLVFLSYASEDRETVLVIHDFLKENGCDPWMDVKRLLPGQNWAHEIEAAIEDADYFLACLSTHTLDKTGYVQRELRMGWKRQIEHPEGKSCRIPVRLDDCVIPRDMRDIQWLDWSDIDGRSRLLQAFGL